MGQRPLLIEEWPLSIQNWVLTISTSYVKLYIRFSAGSFLGAFNGDGNLSEYYVEEGGVVVQAEQYSHENYQWDKTDYAKKSLLYAAPLSEFAFEKENYEYITLDAFNQPQSSETGWETLNTTEDGITKQKQTVAYTYDGDHQLIQARMTVITDHAGEQSSDYVVKKYQYNGMGRVTRTESYVEGEELTTGIAIEENVYDAKGNLIRVVSYHSLDSSAKFYRESVREENGR